MCSEYVINGKTYSTVKDLIALMPMKSIPFTLVSEADKYPDSQKSQWCLCSVDEKKFAKLLNVPIANSGIYFHFGQDEIDKATKKYGQAYVFPCSE